MHITTRFTLAAPSMRRLVACLICPIFQEMHILDLISTAPADSATELVFWDPEPVACSPSELIARGEGTRDWFAERYEPGETVAMLLTASAVCMTSLFGAWRAGLTVASLPIPARGANIEEYARQLETLTRTVGAREIFAESGYCELLGMIGVRASPFEGIASGTPSEDRDGGALVQFTSGTTSDPKGVHLPLDRVSANVEAIVQHLQLSDGDVAFSWLPWSHDMGLIGMVLAPLAGNAVVKRGALHVAKPEHFVADPGLWMQRCAEVGASITAGPDFAMRVAVRAARRSFEGSLEHLRCVITGAEPIRTSTVETFTSTFAEHGMSPSAITPAYGLAEATLAVTIAPIDEPPLVLPTADVDRDGLATASLEASESFQVGCGAPLNGFEVHVADDGVISIAGPSMLSGYVTNSGFVPVDLPFRTRDVGVMRDGQLFVRGRHDDLLIVAGRKFFAHDIEAVVEALAGVHDGGCVATGSETIDVIVEAAGGTTERADLDREVRMEISRHFGAPVGQVVVVEPYGVRKTTSGKKRRLQTAREYLES